MLYQNDCANQLIEKSTHILGVDETKQSRKCFERIFDSIELGPA